LLNRGILGDLFAAWIHHGQLPDRPTVRLLGAKVTSRAAMKSHLSFIKNAKKKVLLILDNLWVRHSKLVKA
jgi:hypothetical protein